MKNYQAFSLLELALILVVIGVLIGLGVGVLSSVIKNNKIRQTQSILERVRESLVGYLMSRGRLPCPDSDGDGQEDSSSGTCTCTWPTCFLPDATINIRKFDAYGRRIYYEVEDDFTTFSDLRGFCVHASSLSPTLQVTDGSSTYSIVAIVVSGGLQDADGDGNILDEENTDGSPFVQEGISITNTYDDFTKEISSAWLLSRVCDVNLRKIKIQISSGSLCYHGELYDSSDGYIFLGSDETVQESSCSGNIKTFDELQSIDWSGDRDGMVDWDGSSWSDG